MRASVVFTSSLCWAVGNAPLRVNCIFDPDVSRAPPVVEIIFLSSVGSAPLCVNCIVVQASVGVVRALELGIMSRCCSDDRCVCGTFVGATGK